MIPLFLRCLRQASGACALRLIASISFVKKKRRRHFGVTRPEIVLYCIIENENYWEGRMLKRVTLEKIHEDGFRPTLAYYYFRGLGRNLKLDTAPALTSMPIEKGLWVFTDSADVGTQFKVEALAVAMRSMTLQQIKSEMPARCETQGLRFVCDEERPKVLRNGAGVFIMSGPR